MNVITFSNVKGGVGKTTTAANLAAVLAVDHGRRVLAVDLDPQSNLTLGLGIDPLSLQATVYDVLHRPALARDVTISTAIHGLDLLPANLDLAGAEVELSAKVGRELRLRRALEGLSDYDDVLIDTPPSLGLFTQNALMAARYVVSPVEPSFYALHALGQLRQMIDDVIQPYNPPLHVLGVVLTRYDSRNRLTAEVESRLRAELGALVFGTVIPVNVKAAEAPAAGVPVTRYAPTSPSARAYRDLAAELLYRLEADSEQG